MPKRQSNKSAATPRAPRGAVKLAREVAKSVKAVGAKAAAKKYGASESYVRRLAKASREGKVGKVFRTNRGLNFLKARIEEAKKEKIEQDGAVKVIPKGMADLINGQHPDAMRGRSFMTRAEAVDHAQEIVGASATLMAYEASDGSWRYGVLDEISGDEFSSAEAAYFGNVGDEA